MLKFIIGIIASYLCGTIPTAFLIAKCVGGIDIREHGSGNVGATNALRVMGKLPGIVVLLLDMGKGVLAVLLISAIFSSNEIPPEIVKAVFGWAVVCGHVFNVFLKFKGGKGVATSAGILLCIAPGSFLVGILFFFSHS